MKKNTKILLGLVALGGVIYLMRKPKATSTEPTTEEETGTGGGGFGGGGIGGGYGMPVISNRSNVPSAPALETAKPVNVQSATTSSAKLSAEDVKSTSTQADAENMINWGIAPIRSFIINRYPTANIEIVNKATSEVANFQRANKSMKGAEANTQIIALIDKIVKPVVTASNAISGGGRSGVGTLDLSSLPRGGA